MPDTDGLGIFELDREHSSLVRELRMIAEEIPAEQSLQPKGATHEVLGLRKPELLRVVSDWLQRTPDVSDANLFELCERLWGGQTREEQIVATRLLARRRSALRQRSWSELNAWRPAVSSIEGADAFSVHVLGPWVMCDVPTRTEALRKMIDDGSMIDRRMALVATVSLAHDEANGGWPEVVLEFVDRAAADTEPMVVDAVTWLLCALSRHHRRVVERFLAGSGALQPLVREQVENWLRTGSRKNQAVHDWRLPKSAKSSPGGDASASNPPSEPLSPTRI